MWGPRKPVPPNTSTFSGAAARPLVGRVVVAATARVVPKNSRRVIVIMTSRVLSLAAGAACPASPDYELAGAGVAAAPADARCWSCVRPTRQPRTAQALATTRPMIATSPRGIFAATMPAITHPLTRSPPR